MKYEIKFEEDVNPFYRITLEERMPRRLLLLVSRIKDSSLSHPIDYYMDEEAAFINVQPNKHFCQSIILEDLKQVLDGFDDYCKKYAPMFAE